jgi:hypothetical protein
MKGGDFMMAKKKAVAKPAKKAAKKPAKKK